MGLVKKLLAVDQSLETGDLFFEGDALRKR